MATPTTKKPTEPIPSGIAWSVLTDNERTIVRSFVRYVDDKLGEIDARMCSMVRELRAGVLEDAKVHINRHCGLGHEGLRVHTNEKVDALGKLLEKWREELQNDSTKAWGMLGDHRGALATMKEDMATLLKSQRDLERKMQEFLTIEDLRKTNATLALMEKDIKEQEVEIAEVDRKVDSARSHLATKSENDTRDFKGIIERLSKLDERMNMAECDIEKLHDPKSFGREPPSGPTAKDVVTVLRSAKHHLVHHKGQSAVSAIIFYTFAGDLRNRALLAMYLAVTSIWTLGPEAPAILTDEVISQLLHEWHDGMVICKEDILLAFDVAIKKEELRV